LWIGIGTGTKLSTISDYKYHTSEQISILMTRVTNLQWITLLCSMLCIYCMTISCTNVSVDDDIMTGSKCLSQMFHQLITYCILNKVQLNTNSIKLIMLGIGPSIKCRPHTWIPLCNFNNSTNNLDIWNYIWYNMFD